MSLSTDEKQSLFPEAFSAEVDSWFSADIACCDHCLGDFVNFWPHAYEADDASFQRSAIDLETFYEGSRLADLYTKEEFDTFILDLDCPRCGEQLGSNIWPYSFPFDLDDNVEQYVHEIGQLAQQTPFLLLNHEFATKTYETVTSVALSLAPLRFSEPLYRARLAC
jgi:hypothetical protein